MSEKKIILHLCCEKNIGSDSIYYQTHEDYEVIMVDEEMDIRKFVPPKNVYGIIANPPCTEFSTAGDFREIKNIAKGMELVEHCIRIIQICQESPVFKFYSLENPFNGRLKEIIGKPNFVYQPWEFGSPWTKKTALWGIFNNPDKIYKKWEDVPKIPELYIRPGRSKPGLVYFHKSAAELIPEFEWAKEHIKTDATLRSMCSNGFAKAFFEANI